MTKHKNDAQRSDGVCRCPRGPVKLRNGQDSHARHCPQFDPELAPPITIKQWRGKSLIGALP